MADDQDDTERSEDPTQKRLDEALERGDVVKSQEVNAWFVLACATLTLMMFSGSMSHGITTTLRGFIANSYAIRVDGNGFLGLVSKLGNEVIAAIAIPFLLLALAGVGGRGGGGMWGSLAWCGRANPSSPSSRRFHRPPV